MSETTNTAWTCDRCKCREVVGQGEQPRTWRAISVANPPRLAEPDRRVDLCEKCYFDFDSWFRRSGQYTPAEVAESPS